MLKPGGYLQWDETDASTLACQTPSPEIVAPATETLVRLQSIFSAQNKLSADWLHDLPAMLEGHGCEIVANESVKPCNELSRAWSDNMLMVWHGVVSMLPESPIPLPPGMGLPETVSRKSYAELLARSTEETSKGAAMGMMYHVLVARKSS